MDSTIPRFRGVDAEGCAEQVSRARQAPMTALGVMLADSRILDRFPTKEHLMQRIDSLPCGCRICETGTIDNSECSKVHLLYPVPTLTIWSDQVTTRLLGAGHLVFWSMWARPAVLALSARSPTITQVRVYLARTSTSMKHTFMRFDYRTRFEPELNTDVVDIIPKSYSETKFPRVNEFLANLPGQWRVGRHTLLMSTKDSNTPVETAY